MIVVCKVVNDQRSRLSRARFKLVCAVQGARHSCIERTLENRVVEASTQHQELTEGFDWNYRL